MMADFSAWSISGVSGNNSTSSIFNKSHSLLQSFERVSEINILFSITYDINLFLFSEYNEFTF